MKNGWEMGANNTRLDARKDKELITIKGVRLCWNNICPQFDFINRKQNTIRSWIDKYMEN